MSTANLHILVCSHDYGLGQGPEAICTMRLVQALLDAGCLVTVITSDKACDYQERSNLKVLCVAEGPFSPRFLFEWLDKILSNWRFFGKDYHIFWQARVLMLPISADVDVIYGRSMPLSSCLAAWRLARRNSKPLVIHFSDPVVSPWYKPAPAPLYFLSRYYRALTSSAVGISFVTKEALSYSERTMCIPIKIKAFVLNHIAPKAMYFGTVDSKPAPVFLYAGSFYGARTPRGLLEGFALFLQTQPAAIFRFVGADSQMVRHEAERLGIAASVEVLPFTRKIAEAYRAADVLVALDSSQGDPVFMSTKIVEYLMTDRQVLLVSPEASPSTSLVYRFPDSAAAVEEVPGRIARAMAKLSSRSSDAGAFDRRMAAMEEYSPAAVAEFFLTAIRMRITNPPQERVPIR